MTDMDKEYQDQFTFLSTRIPEKRTGTREFVNSLYRWSLDKGFLTPRQQDALDRVAREFGYYDQAEHP